MVVVVVSFGASDKEKKRRRNRNVVSTSLCLSVIRHVSLKMFDIIEINNIKIIIKHDYVHDFYCTIEIQYFQNKNVYYFPVFL